MYTLEDLKKLKITINVSNMQTDKNTNEEMAINYEFSNDEKLAVHIQPFEGSKPLFDERCVNRESTPIPQENKASSSNSPNYDKYKNKPTEIRRIIRKLEDMLDVQRKSRSPSVRKVRSSFKRTRRDSRRCSRSSSFSDFSKSRYDSRSPTPKRSRREYNYSKKYSSKYDLENEERTKKDAYRYRESSHTSRSPSSDRSYSRFISRKLEKEMSSFLNHNVLSTDSSSSYDYSSRHDRKNKKDDRSKQRKFARRYEDKNGHYDRDSRDYYHQASSYNDMKERYARYYTVMYAFNIIMDILRKDDLYSSSF